VITRYQHTQMGWLLIVAFAVAMLVIAILMASQGPPQTNLPEWVAWIVLGILLVSLILFATLTVTITGDVLQIRFGPGIIRKSIPLREIESCGVVHNPWYYGWGIRYTPQGWLFRVSGLHGVEVRLRSGRKYYIGTDVPEELERAIRQAIGMTAE
jgi:hypothetical protein